MGRAPCCDKAGVKRGPWTPEEDKKLLAYIEQHGLGNWRSVPVNAGLQRCGKSCRLRWTNYLRPDIKRGKFSLQEEQTIIQLHALLGNRWSTIATHLPKRTDNEIKNYWNTHLRKRLLKMGIDPVTHKATFDPLNLNDGQKSKEFRALSHKKQWENARLEAEARHRETNLNPRASKGLWMTGNNNGSDVLNMIMLHGNNTRSTMSSASTNNSSHIDHLIESPTSSLSFVESSDMLPLFHHSIPLSHQESFCEYLQKKPLCEQFTGIDINNDNKTDGGSNLGDPNLLIPSSFHDPIFSNKHCNYSSTHSVSNEISSHGDLSSEISSHVDLNTDLLQQYLSEGPSCEPAVCSELAPEDQSSIANLGSGKDYWNDILKMVNSSSSVDNIF